ncbi:MAG: hypothetical protein HZC17_09705 [Candidatus Omnitrophica bacterium]|nr:hypothetical protein [Candidatus Omnitrophota bacterium]
MKHSSFRSKILIASLLLFALTLHAPTASFGQAGGTANQTVYFIITIDPAFSLELKSSEGGNVTIGPVLPNGGTVLQTQEVIIHTNQTSPYRIKQIVQDSFVNERGVTLPLSKVKYTVTNGLNGGSSNASGPTQLTDQETVIFTSNSRGDADRFTISYFVDEKKIIAAGKYHARIDIRGERS